MYAMNGLRDWPDGISPSRAGPIVADLVDFGHDAMVENRREAMMAKLEGLVSRLVVVASLLVARLWNAGPGCVRATFRRLGRFKIDRCGPTQFFSIARPSHRNADQDVNAVVTVG
jgi:hypothetical protein